MKKLFDPNQPFFQFMSHWADVFLINLCFLICCIPIVTIGPGLVALYTVTMRMVRGNFQQGISDYWSAFRQNFKQGIAGWLLALIVGGLLLLNVYYSYQWQNMDPSTTHMVVLCISLVVLAIYAAILMFLFPTMAQFAASFPQQLQNAMLFAISNLPKTLCAAVLTGLPVWLASQSEKAFTWMTIAVFVGGIVLVVFLKAQLFVNAFDPYIAALSEGGEADDGECDKDET